MDEDESIMKLGALIDEIYFKKIPDTGLLSELCEMNENIRIHLPMAEALHLHEYAESYCSENIVSANFETDVFIDSEELYKLPNLENLVLTCKNHSIDKLDIRDLHDMQLSIENLVHKKKVVFDLGKINDVPVQQVKDTMRFSGFEIEIIHGKIGKVYQKSKKEVMKGFK